MSRKTGSGTHFVVPESVHNIIIELYVKYGWGANRICKELELEILPVTLIRYLRKHDVKIRKFDERLPQPCKGCGKLFEKDSWNRQLCLVCAPERVWAMRFYQYGVTKPEFDKQFESQNGLCDLCGKPLPEDVGKMRFDHCHEQGHMRGILHNKCNIGLHYIENAEFIGRAVKYIEKWRR